jgi:hypothetical protein
MKRKGLTWILDGIEDRDSSQLFLNTFKNSIPVYSPFVQALFLQYSFDFPQDEGEKVMIIPPKDNTQIIYRVPEQSIESEIPIYIFPGDVVGGKGLFIKIPKNYSFLNMGTKDVPLREGFLDLKEQIPSHYGFPFIPVLNRNAIQRYENNMPHLVVNLYVPEKDHNRSPFEANQIKKVVQKRLEELKL